MKTIIAKKAKNVKKTRQNKLDMQAVYLLVYLIEIDILMRLHATFRCY